MKQLRIYLTLFLFASATVSLFSQPVMVNFEQGLRLAHEKQLLESGGLHSVWPLVLDYKADTIEYSDLQPLRGKFSSTLVGRKLFSHSLLRVQNPDFNLIVDPLVNFEVGRETSTQRNTWVNTRGVRADGTIGHNFSFHTAFYENQAVFPGWIDSITNQLSVVPGQGFIKDFKNKGFDFAFAEGHFVYTPSRYFTFRFGHGKNFVGDGYRSLLLSDAAFNYPYLMINTKVWKLQYTNLYTQFQELSKQGGAWSPWNKKYSTMHHLSWNVTDWFNVGLFEAIIWQASDSTGQRGFDVNYLNPVIFYRPVEFSLGSPDNALLGGSVRFTIRKKYLLFAQLLLDEFKLEHVRKGDGWWANKHGFQIGGKAFDLFGIPNFYAQAEYNHVRPYTYAHNVSLQNYGHYSQPLAHPAGANFREGVFIASYRYQRWMFDYKAIFRTYGADTSGLNFGSDIYKSYYTYVTEFGNTIGQGQKTQLRQHDIRVSWLVNPATNLQLNAGVTMRSENDDVSDKKTTWLWFGLRSALFNQYYDF
ncbi:MAG: hypothetical protein RBS07_13245 [Lentimicrobium sp.]|jgi:hypothetical protein|nr:hypothetical protein [Lentimicrobium sp.]